MQTSVFISPNTLMVECIINPSGGTTQQKNPFGTQMQLQNRKIIGVEALSDQDTKFSPISTGNRVIPAYVFAGAFLTLYTSSVFGPSPGNDVHGKPLPGVLIRPEGLYYDQIPLSVLRRVHNYDQNALNITSGGSDVFRIRPTEIAWTKAFTAIPVAIGISTQYSALYLVHYLDEGDDGKTYM